jgi:hypothetical protein
MSPITYFNVTDSLGITSFIHVVSDSTFSLLGFDPDSKSITFDVYGAGGTVGFARIDIPSALLRVTIQSEWEVNVGGLPVVPNVYTDHTFTYLYCAFVHSAATTIQIRGTITGLLNASWDPTRDSYDQGNYASSWRAGNCYGLSSTEILYFMHYVLGDTTNPYFPAQNPPANTTSQLILPKPINEIWTTLNNPLLAVMFHQVYDPNNAFKPNPSENIEYQKLIGALEDRTPALLLMHGAKEDPKTKTSGQCYHTIVAWGVEPLANGTINIMVSDPNLPQPQQAQPNYDPSTQTFSYSYADLSFYEFEVVTPRVIDTSWQTLWKYEFTQPSWWFGNWLNFSVVGYNIMIADKNVTVTSNGLTDTFEALGGSQTFVCGIPGTLGIEEGNTQVYAIPEGMPFTVSDPATSQSAILIDRVDNESGELVGHGYFLNATATEGVLSFTVTPSNSSLLIDSGTSTIDFSTVVFYATLQDYSIYQGSDIHLDSMQIANLTVNNWQVLNDTNQSPVTLTISIIPEFSSLVLPLFATTVLLIAILYRKRRISKTDEYSA